MPAARTTTAPRHRRTAPGDPHSAPRHARSASTRQRSSRPRRSRRTHPPLRIRWERVGRVVLLVVLAVVLGLYVQQGIAYFAARSQADQQATIVKHLSSQNARLRQEERALNNSATILFQARKLGMVKPGERPYVVNGLPAR